MHWGYIDGLVQERCNSIANALELRLSCTNPSIFPAAVEIWYLPVRCLFQEEILPCSSEMGLLIDGMRPPKPATSVSNFGFCPPVLQVGFPNCDAEFTVKSLI